MLIGIDASRVNVTARTGTETYSREVIAHLVPLAAERGHRLRLYARAPLPPQVLGLSAWPDHVHMHVIPLPRLWTHVALAASLWHAPPDVLFIPAHVIPLLPPDNLPIVVTVHDLGYEHFPHAHPRGQRAYLRWSTRHNIRRAAHILADSQATAQDLTNLYGVPPEKITVIYPGYRPPELLPRAEDIENVRLRYGLTTPYFLYVGTIQPRKNLIRLMDAFARVLDVPLTTRSGHSLPLPVHLALAGKPGWLAEEILERARKPDLRQRVRLLGYVPDADLPALMAGAVALVFPSLYEGFGFPVLEAQALGVPVLTSTTSSLPEVAGDAAHLVPPQDTDAIADGMRRLLDDPILRQRLADKGRANVQRFSWQQTATRILDILETAGRNPASTRSQSSPTSPSSTTTHLDPVTILGVRVHRLTFAQALDAIEATIEQGEKGYVVTTNPEIIMRGQRDPEYKAILNRALMAWPDGIGVLMAAWLLGKPIPERVTGSDGVPLIAARAAQRGWRLYLLGAAPGVAQRAAEVLRQRYPGVHIVGAEPGDPRPEHDDALVARINAVRPDILFVAYGAPKQERWMARNLPRLDVHVTIGVGGAFDFLAGVQKRAPRWMRSAGLEWLWRLIMEPWRWRRQLVLPLFTFKVCGQWWQERHGPK